MTDLLHSRRGTALIVAAIALVFLALRIALLAARDPFFDELFTIWIAGKPFGGIVEALRHDSGPPLYYFAVHAIGIGSVAAARTLSLVAALATLGAVLSARSLGTARFTAAALLTVYPPAVLFAIDARAYALCALLVTIGLLALQRGRPIGAAIAFVAAAYAHYYGALFMPLLLWPWAADDGLPARPSPGFQPGDSSNGKTAPGQDAGAHAGWKPAIFGAALAGVLFAPGLWLALHQPRGAMQWLHEWRWSFLKNISFAGDYAYGLFQPAPMWLVTVAGLLLIVAFVLGGSPRTGRQGAGAPQAGALQGAPWLWAAAVVVPLAIAVAAGVYFPMRFESVIAVPLALWIAKSVERWPLIVRRSIVAVLFVIGAATTYAGILDHAERPLDPYRAAALWLRANVPPGERIVASGYLYLETVTNARPDAAAFPEEQAIHPGWRAFPGRGDALPAVPFVWIGERAAPELSILRKSYRVQPLYANGGALVARVLLH